MKLKLLIPAVAISAILLIGGIFLLRNTELLPPSQALQATMAAQDELNEQRPEDRVYAHLDKPFYAPGETMWFAAYVRDAATLAPSEKSGIVRAELINPKGEVEMQFKVPVGKNGIAQGDFYLPKDLPGGRYTFQAYTLWQTNDENPAIFRKEVQIQKVVLPKLKMDLDYIQEAYAPGDKVRATLALRSNENQPVSNQAFKYTIKIDGEKKATYSGKTDEVGTADLRFTLPGQVETGDVLLNVTIDYNGSREAIARSVPVLTSSLDLRFFPEGGDMVEGLRSRTAFSAVDKAGKAVDVQGYISDSKGKKVADFASLHKGMGAFDITPQGGERYTAHIEFPGHVKQTFKLPKAQSGGYTLAVEEITKDEALLSIGATEGGKVSLITSVRGKRQHSAGVKVKRGKNEVRIPLAELPIGVAQITLFDDNGIARAERMAFVNENKQLDIQVKTDKEKYLPREKVEMDISVRDDQGNPVQTDLSVAVVDDQLLSFADDKSSNILSWMLMEADINLEVDEPSYYFDNGEMDANEAMDYLLMTAGWRRFSWEALANNDLPKMEHRGERMVVAGTVLDSEGNPLSKAKIQILGKGRPVATEGDGYFEIADVDLTTEPVSLAISAPGHYRQEQIVGDYGIFDYQLFDRKKEAAGVVVNERANRLAQAQQLGLADQITQRKPIRRPVSSVFIQNNYQVVNFGKRYEEENEDAAVNFKPEDFEEGVDYTIVDDRIRPTVTPEPESDDEEDESLTGAFLSDVAFYRVREFPVREYKSTEIDTRSDFRSTTFWDGHLRTNEQGKAKVTFWNTDAVASFNITTEGMSDNGGIGRTEVEYYTQMSFSIAAKIPVEVTVGDEFEVPVTLTNNSKKKLSGDLKVKHPANLQPLNSIDGKVTLKKGETKVMHIKYRVKNDAQSGDTDNFAVAFKSKHFNDEISEDIAVVPRGFPTRMAHSGTGMETKYEVKIRDLEENTLEVELQAFPSALTEVIGGMDGMMREPHGCFEQTSNANYPNLLALQYMRETEQSNPEVERKALKLLKQGYKRIEGFRSGDGGFEWFGGPIGHEGITAFAIMQFTHMKEVYKGVDQEMIDGATDWLLKRRDGKGGFLRHERTTWSLGLNADEDVFNSFIVYCLSEAKTEGIENELKHVYKAADKSEDPYLIGMVALAHHNYGETKKAEELTARAQQLLNGATATVSADQGTMFGGSRSNYELEAKSLLLLNLAKAKRPDVDLIKRLGKEIREQRQWNASFGPTHTTVLALRALIAHSKFARQTDEGGTIAFYVDGKKVATKSYEKGERDVIRMEGLERFFGEGDFDFEVKFEGVKHPLPHTVSFKWNTVKPVASPDKPIAMSTDINQEKIQVGDQVRMDVKLRNVAGKNQPTPMAIVGIPAGLSPQARQLNALVDNGKVAYYEISGSNVILYFRHLKKGEQRDIPLDLKADFAGKFKAPASSSYAYYNNEAKEWIDGEEVLVMK